MTCQFIPQCASERSISALKTAIYQGWGRLQRHDYDYDYDYTMITETDYDYDYKTMIMIIQYICFFSWKQEITITIRF